MSAKFKAILLVSKSKVKFASLARVVALVIPNPSPDETWMSQEDDLEKCHP